jgi:hypothetical protein
METTDTLHKYLLTWCSTTICHQLYCWEGLFTAPFHNNGSYSIVACVLVAAVMSLPSCCLAMSVHSDLTISVFGHHVIVFWYDLNYIQLCMWLWAEGNTLLHFLIFAGMSWIFFNLLQLTSCQSYERALKSVCAADYGWLYWQHASHVSSEKYDYFESLYQEKNTYLKIGCNCFHISFPWYSLKWWSIIQVLNGGRWAVFIIHKPIKKFWDGFYILLMWY